jgi:hypothetical protein
MIPDLAVRFAPIVESMHEQPATNGDAPSSESDESAPADNPPADFERFRDLMKKLVRVPKTELDEKRKTS